MTNKNAGKKTQGKVADKPVEPEKLSDLETKILAAMSKLEADGKEVTSTVLKDALGLAKRGAIRTAMRKLSKAGKVAIEQATKGKEQKIFVYRLVKQ